MYNSKENDPLFDKIKNDSELQELLNEIDHSRYKHHSETFYSHAFQDGKYTDEEIAKAHQHLDMKDNHFNAMIEHFVTSLQSTKDQEIARKALERYRQHVLTKKE